MIHSRTITGSRSHRHSMPPPKHAEPSHSYSLDNVAQMNVADVQDAAFMRYLAQQVRLSVSSAERREYKELWTAKLRKHGFFAVAEKLNKCHAHVDVQFCERNHAFNVKVEYRCHLHVCPDCNREKSLRELSRVLPKFLQVLRDDPHLIVALMTLTLLSRKERKLRDGCKEIKRGFKKLRKPSVKIWKNCVGGVGRVENTHSRVHGWHPHLHALVLLKNFMPQRELSNTWHDITGDSKIVDIRQVHNVAEGLLEAIKYPFKPSDIQKVGRAQIAEMLELKGERLGVTFGVLHGLEVEPEENDAYQNFIDETKDLKDGDCCPICKTTVRQFVSVPRIAFENLTASAEPLCKPPRGEPKGH